MLKLFHLGERTYDHLIFLPSKVKGMQTGMEAGWLAGWLHAGPLSPLFPPRRPAGG